MILFKEDILILNKKIAIFGIGVHAQKCRYYLNRSKIDIVCYYDNNYYGITYRGKKVCCPAEKDLKGKVIIVAVSENVYHEIRKQLLSYGLKEFHDFIYYTLIDRRIAIAYGNCHMNIIKSFLRSSKLFSQAYAFYPLPPIMQIELSMISGEVLRNCDLLLSQDIRKDNSYGEEFAIDKIKNELSIDCKHIIVPNLYKLGFIYFPQYKSGFNRNYAQGLFLNGKWDEFGLFPFSDYYIDKMLEEGVSIDVIVKKCSSGTCFSAEEIIKNFDDALLKIKLRELSWDIKCSEYIERNYKKKRLFYEPEHPTNVIFRYICQEILRLLGIADEISANDNLGNYETPIYPEVKETLGLLFENEKVRINDKSRNLDEIASYEEYVRQYIWWRWHGIC